MINQSRLGEHGLNITHECAIAQGAENLGHATDPNYIFIRKRSTFAPIYTLMSAMKPEKMLLFIRKKELGFRINKILPEQ